jgi:hypothetical protein
MCWRIQLLSKEGRLLNLLSLVIVLFNNKKNMKFTDKDGFSRKMEFYPLYLGF